ncbi:tripartite tricarboxylate transporter substrate-binding protein [Bosea sp. CRIB-10]|uniref:tripartite tricarboxylate transporter substrate-binding protein n=1 Tax=Bosea sp. CRIB-10 TaxID=378404 RepID=UPI0015875D5F|nr:tripartite tricarboxylate transporter substrate-binding protein [Bosea sp. CRIB-10]
MAAVSVNGKKARRINLASFGTGSSSHVSGELFKSMAGLDMPHVPYRGSAPMVNDLLAGHVSVGVDNLPASMEFIRTGQLRALGATTAARWPTLSDVPTIGETVPGFEASSWIALGCRAGRRPT